MAQRAAVLLAIVLVISAALLVSRHPDSPGDVTVVPTMQPAPEESAAETSPEAAVPTLVTPSPEEIGGAQGTEHAVAELPSQHEPQGHAIALSPAMLDGDLPPYLGHVLAMPAGDRDPRGCKTSSAMLAEMAAEPRDELWASRMERELRDLLEPHPLDFPVSVGCRATICQISEVGDLFVATGPVGGSARQAYWREFGDRLRASPIAPEFATERCFSGNFSPHPAMQVTGCLFTSVGQTTPAEPTDCFAFTPSGE